MEEILNNGAELSQSFILYASIATAFLTGFGLCFYCWYKSDKKQEEIEQIGRQKPSGLEQ